MIRYQMQCKSDHQFDGWFSNSAAFDTQADAHQIECPVCGSTDVRKAMMAPNLSPRTKLRGDQPAGAIPDGQQPQSATPSCDPAASEPGAPLSGGDLSASPAPDSDAPGLSPMHPNATGSDESFVMMREISNAMRRMRQEVEKNADYVGPRFAEEARKIHYEEVEPRGIYGEATKEDIEELNEEGVVFVPLPSLPEDAN